MCGDCGFPVRAERVGRGAEVPVLGSAVASGALLGIAVVVSLPAALTPVGWTGFIGALTCVSVLIAASFRRSRMEVSAP